MVQPSRAQRRPETFAASGMPAGTAECYARRCRPGVRERFQRDGSLA